MKANRFAVFVSLLSCFLFSFAMPAQQILSTRAGVVQYAERTALVSVEGKPLLLPKGSFFQMENGQTLKSSHCCVEILLNPTAYLRIDGKSSLRMRQNSIMDAEVDLAQGSALVEVLQKVRRSRIRMYVAGITVEINKPGLYRIDAEADEVKVYGGETLVSGGNLNARIKRGRMIRLSGAAAVAKFDAKSGDRLHQWSAQRSFLLFIADERTRTQQHWKPIAQGWLMNFNYRKRFFSQLFFDRWIAAQSIRVRSENEQALAREYERAAQEAADAEAAASMTANGTTLRQ